jgi:hypothetical protein
LIQTQNREGYIGASDTDMVVGNWETNTFSKWWLEKIGLNKNEFTNKYMQAGTNYEHKILDSLGIENLEKDRQIIIDRLRVNLDGNTETTIYEVKTHSTDKEFKVSKKYWRQVQVEMYALGVTTAYIVSYGLVEEDYNNFFNKIDENRLNMTLISYDNNFIDNEYLPKLKILTKCLKEGSFPCKIQQ